MRATRKMEDVRSAVVRLLDPDLERAIDAFIVIDQHATGRRWRAVMRAIGLPTSIIKVLS